jgi:hypothetical protein
MYRLWFTVWFHAPPRFLDFLPFPVLGFPPLGFFPFLGFTGGGALGLCGSGRSGFGAAGFGVVTSDEESEFLGGVLCEFFGLGGGLGLRLAPSSVHSAKSPSGWPGG